MHRFSRNFHTNILESCLWPPEKIVALWPQIKKWWPILFWYFIKLFGHVIMPVFSWNFHTNNLESRFLPPEKMVALSCPLAAKKIIVAHQILNIHKIIWTCYYAYSFMKISHKHPWVLVVASTKLQPSGCTKLFRPSENVVAF